MKIIFVFIFLFLSLLAEAQFEPETGDFLFQDLDCGPLCDAIEEVTVGIDGAQFSHMGIVIVADSGAYVLEAISKGVVLTPLDSFLNRSEDHQGNPKVLVGRLREEYRQLIPGIVALSFEYLGEPYDDVYLFGNGSYYCSELMYVLYSRLSGDSLFFSPEPMTFKQPGSDHIYPAWEAYFQELGEDVPESQPGLNPGGISRSEKLTIVHTYGIPEGYVPAAGRE